MRAFGGRASRRPSLPRGCSSPAHPSASSPKRGEGPVGLVVASSASNAGSIRRPWERNNRDESLKCRRSPDDEGQIDEASIREKETGMNKFILSGAAALALVAAPASAQLLGGVTGAVNGAVGGALGGTVGGGLGGLGNVGGTLSGVGNAAGNLTGNLSGPASIA